MSSEFEILSANHILNDTTFLIDVRFGETVFVAGSKTLLVLESVEDGGCNGCWFDTNFGSGCGKISLNSCVGGVFRERDDRQL